MTELTTLTIIYGVTHKEGNIIASGQFDEEVIARGFSLSLDFVEDDIVIGHSNCNRQGAEGQINISYSYDDEAKKSIIQTTTDTIIADIKTQLTKA